MSAEKSPRGHMAPGDSTDTPAGEVLPALLPRHELREMINNAKRYGRAVKRNALLLAVELRRLQDARAHETYGRASFAQWAATEFADLDLTADAAKKLSRAGRAMLALAEHGRIDLNDPRTFPGATGARALASVLSSHGEQTMLQVFDNTPSERIVGATVNQTIAAVLPPAQPTTEPRPPAAEDNDEEQEVYEVSKEVQELRDRVERLRDLLDDIALADDADPVATTRQYEHFLEDAEALRPALHAVLPAEAPQ
jgi:hypothetical protein